MFEAVTGQILFYATLAFAFFSPGYALLSAIFGKNKTLNTLERFILSFGLGIISVDFLNFSLAGLGLPITRLSLFISIILFVSACLIIRKIRFNKTGPESDMAEEKLFDFSKHQIALIFLLLFLTVFIKTAYLSDTVFPTATDMGHHMYWTQWMVDNHQLPTYDGMPDFIIGEQIPFGTIGLLSGASVFSAFPVVLLLLVNLLGILTVFILALRIFKRKNVAILVLLFLGVLYAVASPQAKFVSGGVVGNILGNLLMPLAFYFYYRSMEFFETGSAMKENSRAFLALAIFTTFGLFYTHHLTAFILLFIFAMIAAIFFIANLKDLKNILPALSRLIFSPQVLAVFFAGLVFFFFIFTPNYIKGSAVNTAVGAPSKETRVGLTMDNLRSSVGEARIALGFLGVMILIAGFKKRNFGHSVILAWAVMIFLMSTQPHLLFINLPSNRIGNYLSYPIAILSAYSLYILFGTDKKSKVSGPTSSSKLIRAGFIVTLTFVLVDGISDSASAFKDKTDLAPVAQTFNASGYLAQKTSLDDMILKDHNYITADSWMKIFLMRGYKYPLSRGYFKRYEDETKPREMCTLQMIASPDNAEARACFAETGTDFIMINPRYDSAQFRKLKNFDQAYSSPGINIYYRNN
ncbi:MAG: DUF1616 domain-containing protein [Candidatus Moranbacteria bacterium]|nr:DUF1616 domain-containing protein [Candidatus Moranbacteria bacterium]